MQETYFTNKAEEIYGKEAVEAAGAHFDDEAVTEAFFAVSAQIDMLVEECEVNVWDAEFRNLHDGEWTFDKILDAADEIATLAHRQRERVWPILASLAAGMRAMARTARIRPAETFEELQKEERAAPPGLLAIAVREDLRPLDIVVASVAEDLGPGTATAAAVASERETCLALVRAQIEKTLGEGVSLEDLDAEREGLEKRLEELEGEPDAEQKIAGVEDDLRRSELKHGVAGLLEEVCAAIEARRPPEDQDKP